MPVVADLSDELLTQVSREIDEVEIRAGRPVLPLPVPSWRGAPRRRVRRHAGHLTKSADIALDGGRPADALALYGLAMQALESANPPEAS
jgi:hypothetical protein